MCFLSGQLTVYYEDPFWIGVFERNENGKLEICKVVFGTEPKDYEVYEFILQNYFNLKFSSPIKEVSISETKKRINPKRLQRQIKKSTQERGISTKAQQAIKLEQESRKINRKKISKEEKELKKKHDFKRRQKKKKQKKRGH